MMRRERENERERNREIRVRPSNLFVKKMYLVPFNNFQTNFSIEVVIAVTFGSLGQWIESKSIQTTFVII
jgi:hypothetical protein